MKRIFYALLIGVFLLLFMCGWLFFTQSGLSAIVRVGHLILGEGFVVQKVSGTVATQIHVEGVTFKGEQGEFSVDTLVLAWQPRQLFRAGVQIDAITVDGLRIRLHQDQEDENSDRASFQGLNLSDVELPLSCRIDDLTLTDVVVISPEGRVTNINRVHLEAEASGADLAVKSLDMEMEKAGVWLTATLRLRDGWTALSEGTWQYNDGKKDWHGKISLDGPLNNGRFEVIVQAPMTAAAQTKFTLTKGLELVSTLSVKKLDPSWFAEGVPGSMDIEARVVTTMANGGPVVDVKLSHVSGTLRGYPLAGHGELHYEKKMVSISSLALQSGASHLGVSGTVGDSLGLHVELDTPEMEELLPGVAGHIRLAARVTGSPRNPSVQYDLSGEKISYKSYSLGSLHSTGRIEVSEKGELKVAVSAKDIQLGRNGVRDLRLTSSGTVARHRLRLDCIGDVLEIHSLINGALQEHRWEGEVAELLYTDVYNGELKLKSSADVVVSGTALQLSRLCLAGQGGSVCADAQVNGNQWHANVGLHDFDPSVISEEWPGSVNVTVAGSGEFTVSGGSHHEVQIENVDGLLHGQPLSGSGSAVMNGSTVVFNDLSFRLGEANLHLNGELDEQLDLQVMADIPNLSLFLPSGRGNLRLSAHLSGSRLRPVADCDFIASDLLLEQYQLGYLAGKIRFNIEPEAPLEMSVEAGGLRFGDTAVEKLSISASGTTSEHRFDLDADTTFGHAEIAGRGHYDTFWQGVLTKARVTSGQFGNWQSEGQPEVVIGRQKAELSGLCFSGEAAQFCLGGKVDRSNWMMTANIEYLALSLLNRLELLSQQLAGTLTANLNASGNGGRIEQVNVNLRVPEMVLTNDIEALAGAYIISDTTVQAKTVDGNLLVDTGLKLQDRGVVQARLEISGINDAMVNPSLLPLNGRIDAKIEDLSLVSVLTNQALTTNGRLNAGIDVSGTVVSPLLDGDIELNDGELMISDLGISLASLKAAVQGEENGITFDVSAKAGPGELQAEGVFSFGEGETDLQARVHGTDALVVDTEEYSLHANPDITLTWGTGGNTVQGKVEIPYARITSVSSTGAVKPSEDVVIVDAPVAAPKKNPVTIDITLILGDDVIFSGYGIRTHLLGELLLQDRPGKLFTAQGELYVKDGKYSFYSTELDIERGRLLFSGGPIDNPGVDLRAQRKVQKNIVGVDVSGVLDALDFELFSDPVLEDSDVLAYIIVGRSMYSSSGEEQSLIGAAATAIGLGGANKIMSKLGDYLPIDEIYLEGSTKSEDMSLVLGKNITEDLFVGYDHSFFDSKGEFKIRYTLGKGFSFETKSSIVATSGDLLYTIEQ